MSNEDSKRYALLITIRRRPSLPRKEKIGKICYFAMFSEKLIQVAISLLHGYVMLVYFDAKNFNYDMVIMKKKLSMMRQDV